MKENKASKIITRIFNLLLLSFTILYLSASTGYYEYSASKKVELNEEQIKKFEQDTKDGKDITLTDYIEEDKTYNNIASDIGNGLSNQISNFMTNGIDVTFNFLGQLFGS